MKYTLLKNKETGARSVRINKTGEKIFEAENPVEYAKLRRKALNNLKRAVSEEDMRMCGLTKVRGAVSGHIYWE